MDNFANIHVNNRAQLINDALSLARAKYVSYPRALDFTNYLTYETEYLPWAAAFSSLEYINDRLVSEADSLKIFEVSAIKGN
jgi:aminopeptidase N